VFGKTGGHPIAPHELPPPTTAVSKAREYPWLSVADRERHGQRKRRPYLSVKSMEP
jgi:hypothetical protein